MTLRDPVICVLMLDGIRFIAAVSKHMPDRSDYFAFYYLCQIIAYHLMSREFQGRQSMIHTEA